MSRSIHENRAKRATRPLDCAKLQEKRAYKTAAIDERALQRVDTKSEALAVHAREPAAPDSSVAKAADSSESFTTEDCIQAYATLRVLSHEMSPEIVSVTLGLPPTKIFRTADASPRNAWTLTTNRIVDALEPGPHIDWLLASLARKAHLVAELRAAGSDIEIVCHIVARSPHAAILALPGQMAALASLGITLRWDVTFIPNKRRS